MAGTAPATSTPPQDPRVTQALEAERDGKAQRIIINGQAYLIFNVTNGNIGSLPPGLQSNIDKVEKVAKVIIDSHTQYAHSPQLQGQSITQIDHTGVTYSLGTKAHHHLRINNIDQYLQATEDFEWQTHVLQANQNLSQRPDTDQLNVSELTPDFRNYLNRIVTPNQTEFTVAQLKEHLLKYTKFRLLQTYGPIRPEFKHDDYQNIKNWMDYYSTCVRTLIEASNTFLSSGSQDDAPFWQGLTIHHAFLKLSDLAQHPNGDTQMRLVQLPQGTPPPPPRIDAAARYNKMIEDSSTSSQRRYTNFKYLIARGILEKLKEAEQHQIHVNLTNDEKLLIHETTQSPSTEWNNADSNERYTLLKGKLNAILSDFSELDLPDVNQ